MAEESLDLDDPVVVQRLYDICPVQERDQLEDWRRNNRAQQYQDAMQLLHVRHIILKGHLALFAKCWDCSTDAVRARLRRSDDDAKSAPQAFARACVMSLFYSRSMGMSEAAYFEALHTADDAAVVDVIRQQLPPGRIARERRFLWGRAGVPGQFAVITRVLDGRLRAFFRTHRGGGFPAVDLASGAATYPVAYSQHFAPPRFLGHLSFYPTEHEGGFAENPCAFMIDCLYCMIDEVRGKPGAGFMFSDGQGTAVFQGERVRLGGLLTTRYNGCLGTVTGETDPTDDTRFAVTVEGGTRSLSLKPHNLTRAADHNPTRGMSTRQATHGRGSASGVIAELGSRAEVIDLRNHSTWKNLAAVTGACALVTCTSLLTQVGPSRADLWKDSMKLASQLLTHGGYFLQYDTDKYGDFGDTEVMSRFAQSESLDLVLDHCSEPIEYSGHGCREQWGRLLLLVWQKVVP